MPTYSHGYMMSPLSRGQVIETLNRDLRAYSAFLLSQRRLSTLWFLASRRIPIQRVAAMTTHEADTAEAQNHYATGWQWVNEASTK
jgi:hypothetical protein